MVLRRMLLDGIAAKRFPPVAKPTTSPSRAACSTSASFIGALVIVSGDEGTGKSVAACQIVKATLLSGNEPPPPFAAIESVYDVTVSWVAELVAYWRNSTEAAHRYERAETAIARLIGATSGEPPILRLALDGIDEVGPTPEYHAIGQILRFFHEEDEQCQAERRPPRAVLLVTCRDPEEVYRAWIYRGGFPSGADDSNVLRFTRFSDAELCEIANRVLADDVASRIQYTANLAAFADFPAGKATSSAASSVLCPVPIADNPEVLMAVQAAALYTILATWPPNECVGSCPMYLTRSSIRLFGVSFPKGLPTKRNSIEFWMAMSLPWAQLAAPSLTGCVSRPSSVGVQYPEIRHGPCCARLPPNSMIRSGPARSKKTGSSRPCPQRGVPCWLPVRRFGRSSLWGLY